MYKRAHITRVGLAFCPVLLGLVLAGCIGMDPLMKDQMAKWDESVFIALKTTQPKSQKWISAYDITRRANFKCQNEWEREQAENWRRQWAQELRRQYMENLSPQMDRVRDAWEHGALKEGGINLSNGDQARKTLLAQIDGELPFPLKDCLVLADLQMGSDRNLARMKAVYRGYRTRLAKFDLEGGSPVVKQIDEMMANCRKVDTWHAKIDEFMAKLSDPNVVLWAPLRPATYKKNSIVPMEQLRDSLIRQCKVTRWTVVVNGRKNDYRKISELSKAGRFEEAMKIFASHEPIVRPKELSGLAGVVDFNDSLERNLVANGPLGREIVRNLVQSGLSGVQYCRRVRRAPWSMLILGSAPLDAPASNRREVRRAFKVAELNARQSYSQYINTFIESLTRSDIDLKDGETFEQFKDHVREVSKATMNNMVPLARCIKEDEVIVVLGWRDPDVGNPVPGELESVKGQVLMEISTAVGAYL